MLHIIGGGIAGLTAALEMSERGHLVHLYEATNTLGGRLGKISANNIKIDNGTHLIMGANKYALALIDKVNSRGHFLQQSYFEFIHLSQPQEKRIYQPHKLIPQTSFIEHLPLLKLLSPKNKHLQQIIPNGAIYENFLAPLCVSALNTPPERASAKLFAQTMKAGFSSKDAMTAFLPRDSYHQILINPIHDEIKKNHCQIHFGSRLKNLHFDENRITHLEFSDRMIAIKEHEAILLALPLWEVNRLLGQYMTLPDGYEGIYNIHYILPEIITPRPQLIGILGGIIDWIFMRDNLLSITISACNERPDKAVIDAEILQSMGIDCSIAQHRVVFEKRATFSQTPENEMRRPDNRTKWENLWLAGDYTTTNLPASIDGAAKSAHMALELME